MYDRGLLEQIKDRLPLSQIVGKRVSLQKKGKEFLGVCPFHQEKSPSFTVNDDKAFFHCFGCGAHGSVFDFLSRTEGLTFREALERAAQLAGVSLPESTPEQKEDFKKHQGGMALLEEASLFFQAQLQTPPAASVRAYMVQRRITPEISEHFQLGYAPSAGDALKKHLLLKGHTVEDIQTAGLLTSSQRDLFRGRLMFPIQNTKGQVVGFGGRALTEDQKPKYLNSPETPFFQKGALLYHYFGASTAPETTPLLIVEGYMDVIALWAQGFLRAVAPLGTALTEAQIALAWRKEATPMVVMDGDEPGKRAQMRALDRVLPLLKPNYSLSFVDLPLGEDPDSYVAKVGFQGFSSFLQYKKTCLEKLWEGLYDPELLKTPEKKAFFEKTLFDKVALIQDPGVRSQYTQAIKNLLFELRRAVFQKKEPTGSRMRAGALADFDGIQAKICLLLVLRFPLLLEEIEEAFSTLEMDFSLHGLKEAILSYVHEGKPLEKDALYAYLEGLGHEASLEQLTNPSLQVHVPSILKATGTLDEARSLWKSAARTLRKKHLQLEKEEARQALAKDFTEEAWKRYQALCRYEEEDEIC